MTKKLKVFLGILVLSGCNRVELGRRNGGGHYLRWASILRSWICFECRYIYKSFSYLSNWQQSC